MHSQIICVPMYFLFSYLQIAMSEAVSKPNTKECCSAFVVIQGERLGLKRGKRTDDMRVHSAAAML